MYSSILSWPFAAWLAVISSKLQGSKATSQPQSNSTVVIAYTYNSSALYTYV